MVAWVNTNTARPHRMYGEEEKEERKVPKPGLTPVLSESAPPEPGERMPLKSEGSLGKGGGCGSGWGCYFWGFRDPSMSGVAGAGDRGMLLTPPLLSLISVAVWDGAVCRMMACDAALSSNFSWYPAACIVSGQSHKRGRGEKRTSPAKSSSQYLMREMMTDTGRSMLMKFSFSSRRSVGPHTMPKLSGDMKLSFSCAAYCHEARVGVSIRSMDHTIGRAKTNHVLEQSSHGSEESSVDGR